MELTKGQTQIVEALIRERMTVVELIEATGLSDSFVRNQLRYMEAVGQVEKVDNRTPFIYRVPTDNPFLKQKELIDRYKKEFITPGTKLDAVGIFLNKFSKTEWPAIADNLEAAAHAIRALEQKNLLFNTLED